MQQGFLGPHRLFSTKEQHGGHLSLWPPGTPPTILGLAGTVVWLQQVTFHTAAREGAIRVGAELAAGAVHRALIKVCQEKIKGMVICKVMGAGKCVPSDTTTVHPYSYVGGQFGRI